MLVINLMGELQATLPDSTTNPAMVSQATAKAAEAMANEVALVDWLSRHVQNLELGRSLEVDSTPRAPIGARPADRLDLQAHGIQALWAFQKRPFVLDTRRIQAFPAETQ